jgi:regulator of replication initiation timing
MKMIALDDAFTIAEILGNQMGEYLVARLASDIRRLVEENQNQPISQERLRSWLVEQRLTTQEVADNLVIFNDDDMPMI